MNRRGPLVAHSRDELAASAHTADRGCAALIPFSNMRRCAISGKRRDSSILEFMNPTEAKADPIHA
jgi:hypothetical protein